MLTTAEPPPAAAAVLPLFALRGRRLLPIVQGGMGVGVSAHRLAGNVALHGAVGTLGGQGMALGMNNAFQSLGRVVGPLWAGTLFDVNISLPYSSAAVIMLVTFLLGLVWLRRGQIQAAGAPQPPVMSFSADD